MENAVVGSWLVWGFELSRSENILMLLAQTLVPQLSGCRLISAAVAADGHSLKHATNGSCTSTLTVNPALDKTTMAAMAPVRLRMGNLGYSASSSGDLESA